MIIRKEKLSDSKELLRLLNVAPELQTSWEGNTYSKEWVKTAITNKEQDLVLIAEEKAKIAGFILAEMWKKKKYSFLSDLFVRAEYRKKGVAITLMKEYEKICRKERLRRVMLLTTVSNTRMQGFIEKRGIKKEINFIYMKKN